MEEQELDKYAGPGLAGKPPRLDLALVRLDGKNGGFFRIKGEERKCLGNEIEITPLKARQIFTAFERNRKTGEITRYFTNEHNSWRDVINLFVLRPNSEKAEFLDTGTIKQLRETWTNLKMTQILYCLMKDEVVKLSIKGASLSNWFEFRDSLEDRSYKYVIKVKQIEEESPLGPYFVMTFAIKEPVEDMDKIAEKMKEIHEELTKIDAYYAEQQEEIKKEILAQEEIPEEKELPEKKLEEINAELNRAAQEEKEEFPSAKSLEEDSFTGEPLDN